QCNVAVTGVSGLSNTPTPSYSNNTDTGNATATSTYGGDSLHAALPISATFAIGQAGSSTVVTCPAAIQTYTGSAQTPCTVAVTGVGGVSNTPTPTYSNNTDTCTATANYTYGGDLNHTGSTGSATFAIGQ